MKTWKITNTSKQPIKISMKTSSSTSKGLILQPEEFCIALPQLTAPIDAQKRKKFITIDENYENTKLELGVAFKKEVLTEMEEAERNAVEYIKKSK